MASARIYVKHAIFIELLVVSRTPEYAAKIQIAIPQLILKPEEQTEKPPVGLRSRETKRESQSREIRQSKRDAKSFVWLFFMAQFVKLMKKRLLHNKHLGGAWGILADDACSGNL